MGMFRTRKEKTEFLRAVCDGAKLCKQGRRVSACPIWQTPSDSFEHFCEPFDLCDADEIVLRFKSGAKYAAERLLLEYTARQQKREG